MGGRGWLGLIAWLQGSFDSGPWGLILLLLVLLVAIRVLLLLLHGHGLLWLRAR